MEKHPEIKKTGKKFLHKNSRDAITLPAKFSPELCRILGIIHGDGNMSNGRVVITDKCLEYHGVIKNLFEKVFSVKPNIFFDRKRHTLFSFKEKCPLQVFG